MAQGQGLCVLACRNGRAAGQSTLHLLLRRLSPVALASAVAHGSGITQAPLPVTHQGEKAEAELTVAAACSI